MRTGATGGRRNGCKEKEKCVKMVGECVIMLIFFFQLVRRILSFTLVSPLWQAGSLVVHVHAPAGVVRGREIWESGQL